MFPQADAENHMFDGKLRCAQQYSNAGFFMGESGGPSHVFYNFMHLWSPRPPRLHTADEYRSWGQPVGESPADALNARLIARQQRGCFFAAVTRFA